jgi:hypothetical protein
VFVVVAAAVAVGVGVRAPEILTQLQLTNPSVSGNAASISTLHRDYNLTGKSNNCFESV